MYNIQVHVPYEKQQYIKKMNHYITEGGEVMLEVDDEGAVMLEVDEGGEGMLEVDDGGAVVLEGWRGDVEL